MLVKNESGKEESVFQDPNVAPSGPDKNVYVERRFSLKADICK